MKKVIIALNEMTSKKSGMMTLENTDGYTQGELDELNAEFERRLKNGDWDHLGFCSKEDSRDEAEKQFSDEVSRR